MKIVSIVPDDANPGTEGLRVTLKSYSGKTFTVNIPENAWADPCERRVYGLNLVFDHSGRGDHYR
jgi:hypothetical protein